MLLFRGVVAELRSARHDACSPLFRGPRDRMTAAVVQVTGVCMCVCLYLIKEKVRVITLDNERNNSSFLTLPL